MQISRDNFLRKLVDIQYARNDVNLTRGHFRVRGDSIDIFPSHHATRWLGANFFGDEIESVSLRNALSGELIRLVDKLTLYPSSHYVTDRSDMRAIIKEILQDLGVRLRELRAWEKWSNIKDSSSGQCMILLLEHLGFCPGIENYSRYLSGVDSWTSSTNNIRLFFQKTLLQSSMKVTSQSLNWRHVQRRQGSKT